jgi:tRNA pseudouridine38-40 synthase
MMRRMAGCVMEVGLGKRPASDVDALLDPAKRERLTWPLVLPAKGLTLMKVRYGPHPRDAREREGASGS